MILTELLLCSLFLCAILLRRKWYKTLALSCFTAGILLNASLEGGALAIQTFWTSDGSPKHDQLAVPHTLLPGLFSHTDLTFVYPGGNRILADEPVIGFPIDNASMFYLAEDAEISVYCQLARFPSRRRYSSIRIGGLFNLPFDPGAVIVSLKYDDKVIYIPGLMRGSFRHIPNSDNFIFRSFIFDEDDARRFLSFMADVPFPRRVDVFVSDDRKAKTVALTSIWSTGPQAPSLLPPYQTVLQPKSEPFAVMLDICRT